MNDKPVKSAVESLNPLNVVKAAHFSNIALREKLAIGLFVLFAVAVLSTYTLIFLWGFQKIGLPGPFVHWLGGATIGQTATLLILVVKDLFPAKKAS